MNIYAETQVNKAIADLETALREAASRAMQPDMPILIALGYFRAVIDVAKTLRLYRTTVGLPPGLSDELVLLLGSVRDCAIQRFYEVGAGTAMGLRILNAFCGLGRATIAALPPPRKFEPKKIPTKSVQSPPLMAKPVVSPRGPILIPPLPARRRDIYDNIGAIAVRTMDVATMKDPIASAFRKPTRAAVTP